MEHIKLNAFRIAILFGAILSLHINMIAQVISYIGDSHWVEKHAALYSNASHMFTVNKELVASKMAECNNLSDTLSQIQHVSIFVNLNFFTKGEKFKVNNSLEAQSLLIKSENAHYIRLIFSEFEIVEGDELYIYNMDKTFLMGPFTSINNPDGGSYATDILHGSDIILEYHSYKETVESSKIVISHIVHGINTVYENHDYRSPDCLIDVNCPEGDGWDNQKKGSCFILKLGDPNAPNTSGSPWASATLLNNTSLDRTPYIFTAWHNTQGTGSDLSLWIFRFKNWRGCDSDTPNHVTISYCGAQMLEAWENNGQNNDVALLRMYEEPLNDIYYCGWDRRNITPSSSTLLSHPQPGDFFMKISKSNSISSSLLWWTSQWYIGGAGSGSSGGGLFNGEKRVIGAHHGRASYDCDADATAGKLSFSWTTPGKNGHKISKWLDPINSEVNILDGITALSCDPDLITLDTPILDQPNITQNTIWITEKAINGSLVIKSGATLSILNTTVRFLSESQVIVHRAEN